MNHTPDNQPSTDYTARLRQADLAAALTIDHAAVAEALAATGTDGADGACAEEAGTERAELLWQLTRWFGARVPLPLLLAVEASHGAMPWQASLALAVVTELAMTADSLARQHTERTHPRNTL